MHHTQGSILNFTPDHSAGVAKFRNGDDEWTEPVIGWAIVVNWSSAESHPHGGPPDNDQHDIAIETRIEAVVLDQQGHACTTNDYLAGAEKGTRLRGIQLSLNP